MRVARIASMMLLVGTAGSAHIGSPDPVMMPEVVATTRQVRNAAELVELGNSLLGVSHYDEAITAFTEALRIEPDHGIALAHRALAYAWTNRLEEAGRDLKAAEGIIPDHAVIHRVRALIAMRLSDFETAIDEWSTSLAKEPGNPISLKHRAYIYQRQGNDGAALADAETYISTNPESPDGYVLRARILVGQQERALAIAEANRLADLFPNDAYSLAAAAQIYDALADRGRALEVLSKAISIDPDDFYYHLLRADVRPWDDFAGRRADLEAALRLDPRNGDVVTRLGLLDFKQQRWTAAVAKFSAVLDEEPNDFGLLAYRAAAHLSAGNRSLALRDFEAASGVASGPDDFSLMCSVFARENVALEWALDACNRAVASNEKESEYRANRGLVKLRLGRLDEALTDYNAAIAADDREATAYYGRALVCWRQGEKEAAEVDRKQAIALDPAITDTFREYGFTDFDSESPRTVAGGDD